MYFPTSANMIEFIILAQLKHGDSYGYQLAQAVKQLGAIKESTLYPILKRLEKDQLLVTYSQIHQGRKRKYYQLTPTGEVHLGQLSDDWDRYTETVAAIIQGGDYD